MVQQNAPVPSGFTNPDGSNVMSGYHIIFNPSYADLCFPAVMTTIMNMKDNPFNPLTPSSQGGRIHGADIYLQWSTANAGMVDGNHYPNYYCNYDSSVSSSSSSDSEDSDGIAFTPVPRVGQTNFDPQNSTNTCIANNSYDWGQWSKAINSIQGTQDSRGRNLCMNVLDTEGFFEHERMREKCQIIILQMGENGQTQGFVCISDLRYVVQNRLHFQNSDSAHYLMDWEGDEVIHGEDYLYIDGLCSNMRGVGVSLTDKVIEMTYCASNIFRGVKLASLPYVVKYYWNKFCFRFRPGCFPSKPDPITFGNINHASEFLPLMFPENGDGKKYKRINDIVNTLKTAPKGERTWTDETMFSDPVYSEFLLSLNETQFKPGVIQPSGAPSLRTVTAKKPPARRRIPPKRYGINKTSYEKWRQDNQDRYMSDIFGPNYKKMKLSKDKIDTIVAASFQADKEGTTPVGEGIYMYLCFNTHQTPFTSMTLGYPCRSASPYVEYLLSISKSEYDKHYRKQRAVNYKEGGKKRRKRTKRRKRKKTKRRKKRRKTRKRRKKRR